MHKIVVGNILSVISNILTFVSTRVKSYRLMMIVQSADAITASISSLILGGYSGAVTKGCAAIRNLTCAIFDVKRWVKVLFILLTIITSVLFMDKQWYEVLPIVASVYYALVILNTQDVKKAKEAIIVNNILWIVYELVILDFAGIAFKLINIISCIQAIIVKNKQQGDK